MPMKLDILCFGPASFSNLHPNFFYLLPNSMHSLRTFLSTGVRTAALEKEVMECKKQHRANLWMKSTFDVLGLESLLTQTMNSATDVMRDSAPSPLWQRLTLRFGVVDELPRGRCQWQVQQGADSEGCSWFRKDNPRIQGSGLGTFMFCDALCGSLEESLWF